MSSNADMSESHRVAVIGAGISGVCAAAHLLRQGLSVTVLERCDVAGGVWHFDTEAAHDPSYPNERPSKGDYARYTSDESVYVTPPQTPDGVSGKSNHHKIKLIAQHRDEVRVSHAPPGPCYFSLKNNVPLTLMKTSLLDWPAGLEEFVSQKHLEAYIQQIAKVHGVEQVTEYNTRVESVTKAGSVWEVCTASLRFGASAEISQVCLQTREFDAVVVASGHYHMPRVPDLPGLKEWKDRYPTRVRHSKTWRSADGLDNQKVLLIGSGVSSCDIAKDLAVKNTQTYQSARGGVLELPVWFLPENALRIGPVERFVLDTYTATSDLATRPDALPGHVILQNGSKLCGIHQVILGTGYITSYPFLSQFHSDHHPRTLAGDDVLVTSEGDMVHNLHKDIFYIEDPTLAFVGVPYHIATFSLYDFQAQVVARVLAGLVNLPSRTSMRAEYEARVEQKGLGRDFHSLRDPGAEMAYVQELVQWVNQDVSRIDNRLMTGHTEEWMQAHFEQKERMKLRVGNRRAEADAGKYDHVVLPVTALCL